jgi:hypothetical protein
MTGLPSLGYYKVVKAYNAMAAIFVYPLSFANCLKKKGDMLILG